MNHKEKITDDVRFKMYESGMFSFEQVDRVSEILSSLLRDYDIEPAERQIVVYDHSDKDMVMKFFLAKGAQGLSPTTISYYKMVLKKFFMDVNKHIKDIEANDIRLYLAELRMKSRSPCTQDNVRRVISTFFTFLRDENYIECDISKKVKKIKIPERLKKPFTEDEMELIRESAMRIGTRETAIVEFLYSTGARATEAVGVNIEDVDFINKESFVIGKGNKMRNIYLSSRSVSALRRYIKEWNIISGPLFLARTRTRLTTSGLRNLTKKISKDIGIHVYPHRFRHTAATISLRRGMSLEMVGKMLGHNSMNTTTRYARSADEDLKWAHKKYLT